MAKRITSTYDRAFLRSMKIEPLESPAIRTVRDCTCSANAELCPTVLRQIGRATDAEMEIVQFERMANYWQREFTEMQSRYRAERKAHREEVLEARSWRAVGLALYVVIGAAFWIGVWRLLP